MSRVGNPYDNAKAESFMKTLKQEQVRGQQWRDLDALRADLTTFFEITYNRQRLHSALGYQTPAAFEQQLRSVANGETSTEMTGVRELTAPPPRPHSPVYNLFRKRTVPSSFVSRQGCTPIMRRPQGTRASPLDLLFHKSGGRDELLLPQLLCPLKLLLPVFIGARCTRAGGPLGRTVRGSELLGFVGHSDVLEAFALGHDAIVKRNAGGAATEFVHFKRCRGLLRYIKALTVAIRSQENMIVNTRVDGLAGNMFSRCMTAEPFASCPDPASSNQFSGASTA